MRYQRQCRHPLCPEVNPALEMKLGKNVGEHASQVVHQCTVKSCVDQGVRQRVALVPTILSVPLRENAFNGPSAQVSGVGIKKCFLDIKFRIILQNLIF